MNARFGQPTLWNATGNLSQRTDFEHGTLHFAGECRIRAGDLIDLAWGELSRLSVVAGSVDGRYVAISGGEGAVLPAQFTDITVTLLTLRDWNLTQLQPHTQICEGITRLKFQNCNLLNCDVPEDAVVESCLTCHKSFCSHLHPDWIAHGLPECAEVCDHVAETDEIEIDGATLTIYTYADEVVP